MRRFERSISVTCPKGPYVHAQFALDAPFEVCYNLYTQLPNPPFLLRNDLFLAT
jgi:hypothetical protein